MDGNASTSAQSSAPVLEFEDVTLSAPAHHDAGLYRCRLRLMASDLVLVFVDSASLRFPLADLATGLLLAESGRVRFQGEEWGSASPLRASRMRGRIGRVLPPGGGGIPAAWLPSMELHRGMVLPHVCHGRGKESELLERAGRLCEYFSMPGLPLTRPGEISGQDLARCECVRALLTNPELLVLECPMASAGAGAADALVNLVRGQRARGAAVLWTTDSSAVFSLAALRPTARYRLVGSQLAAVGEPGLGEVEAVAPAGGLGAGAGGPLKERT